MRPIRFRCEAILHHAPEAIASQILDLTNWPKFQGYGFLPGIKSAEFELRTPAVVGTRIRVCNLDGSSHVEEIAEWDPARRLRLHFTDFSPPVLRLATGFDETWEFERIDGATKVTRSFELHPKSIAARCLLRVIAIFLKKAIARHLQQMQ